MVSTRQLPTARPAYPTRSTRCAWQQVARSLGTSSPSAAMLSRLNAPNLPLAALSTEGVWACLGFIRIRPAHRGGHRGGWWRAGKLTGITRASSVWARSGAVVFPRGQSRRRRAQWRCGERDGKDGVALAARYDLDVSLQAKTAQPATRCRSDSATASECAPSSTGQGRRPRSR